MSPKFLLFLTQNVWGNTLKVCFLLWAGLFFLRESAEVGSHERFEQHAKPCHIPS